MSWSQDSDADIRALWTYFKGASVESESAIQRGAIKLFNRAQNLTASNRRLERSKADLVEERDRLTRQLEDAEQRITHGVQRMTENAAEQMDKTLVAESALIGSKAHEALRSLQEVLDADFAGSDLVRELGLAQSDIQRLRVELQDCRKASKRLADDHESSRERHDAQVENLRGILGDVYHQVDLIEGTPTRQQVRSVSTAIKNLVEPHVPEEEENDLPW